jgi:hypothetical protein
VHIVVNWFLQWYEDHCYGCEDWPDDVSRGASLSPTHLQGYRVLARGSVPSLSIVSVLSNQELQDSALCLYAIRLQGTRTAIDEWLHATCRQCLSLITRLQAPDLAWYIIWLASPPPPGWHASRQDP